MIALIEILGSKVVQKEYAEKWNLVFQEVEPSKLYRDKEGKIQLASTYQHFKEDLIYEEETDKYYNILPTGFKEEISSYYILEGSRYTDTKIYVKLEEKQMVNLLRFAPEATIEYKIIRTLEATHSPTIDLHDSLNTIENKYAKLLEMNNQIIDKLQWNQKVNVHVGGGLITTYNEVMLKEDSCTDELQEELSRGYRILAVCVQPDQRRPDYILARYNPNFDGDSMAKR